MGRGSEQTFLQRRHTDGQQVHEKAPNIISHQGNATQNTMRYHFTPVRINKKPRNNKRWRDMEKREHFWFDFAGNVN